MRNLRLVLLGILLVLPLGCGGKTEEEKTKSPDKTEGAAAEDTKGNQTAQNNAKKNTQPQTNNNTKPNDTKTNGTKTISSAVDVPPSDGSEYAMVPQNAIAVLSARPVAIIASPFIQAMPEKDEMEKGLAEMEKDLGIDPMTVASVTVALWPGDGHIVPELPQMMAPRDRGPGEFEKGPPREDVDKFKEFDDCNFQEFEGPGGPGGPAGGNPLVGMIMNMVPKLDGAVVIKLTEPLDLPALQEKVPPLAALQEEMVEGKKVMVHPGLPMAGGPALYQPDPNTLVITFKDDLAEILNSQGEGELAKLAKAQGSQVDAALLLDFVPFKPLIQMGAGLAAAQAPDANKILPKLTGTAFFVDWNEGVDVNIVVDAEDEQTTQLLKKQFDDNVPALEAQISQFTSNAPPGTSEETKAAMEKVSKETYDSLKGEADGTRFQLSLRVPPSATDVINKAAEEQKKQMSGMNNLKQIGIAAHNFHDRYKGFPFPSGNREAPENEKGKLSWRVHLLPYLEEQALYEQFNLEEPWDSEHNKALLEKMPDVFKLSEGTKPGHTQIVSPVGEGFLAEGNDRKSFASVRDGASNTVMVLTVKPEHAVPWTKPGGFQFDPAKASEVLGGRDDGFLALFADGRVTALDPNLEPDTIKAILTISGGEVVNSFELSGERSRGPGFGPSPDTKTAPPEPFEKK